MRDSNSVLESVDVLESRGRYGAWFHSEIFARKPVMSFFGETLSESKKYNKMNPSRISDLRARCALNPHTPSAVIITELLDEIEALQKRRRVNNGFQPPCLTDVQHYAEEIGLPLTECGRFIDHHEARGWRLGKGLKMACWKSALRTWKANFERFNPVNGKRPLTTREKEIAMGM